MKSHPKPSRNSFLKHRRPASAAKVVPAGHTKVATTCPTCKGTGSVVQSVENGVVNPASLVSRSVGRIK